MKITQNELEKILKEHEEWHMTGEGKPADLRMVDLQGLDLSGACLAHANLEGAYLCGANLSGANLFGARLISAFLDDANLTEACLNNSLLEYSQLTGAILKNASLKDATLRFSRLMDADLSGADLTGAVLAGASLRNANLEGVRGLVKVLGVEPGNIYWRRFRTDLIDGFQFKVGLNILPEGFNEDERVMSIHPFCFGPRSWWAANYPDWPIEVKVRIPHDARINEPWTTLGIAYADKLEILQVFDAVTGEDITEKYQKQ